MSNHTLEIVRGVYERWGKGDFAAGAELIDQASVLVLHPQFADAGIYAGPEEVRTYMRGLLEAWEHLTIRCLAAWSAEDCVVAEVEQSGTGRLSGAETSLRYFQVWTFRGGNLMRLENIMDRGDAFAAAGLEPA